MRSSIMTIPSDHPSLSGHFPGNPIVPGVVILDTVIRMAQQCRYPIAAVTRAKFKARLLPETPFHVELSPFADGLDFRVLSGEQLLVDGTLRCRDQTPRETT